MSGPEDLKGKWTLLKDRAVFRLTGPDRVRYLNGQVTNDVSRALKGESVPACVCNVKGKVGFLIWISALEDCLIIDGQLDQREELFLRLDRYLIADDCELEDITGELELVHHWNEDGPGIASRRSHLSGFDLWIPPGTSSFAEKDQISVDEFAALQLQSRIPASPWEISGEEFPAELGIENWTVDFHKGCYLGQEVISRIKSVGRVKRHLVLVSAETPLGQDSDVRTAAGAVGRVTRPSWPKSEKNHLTFCLIKEAREITQLTDYQEVELVVA